MRTAPILIPATKNPQVFFDRGQIEAVAKLFSISTTHELNSICASVAAFYQEKDAANEIGVYGLKFRDEESARSRYKTLMESIRKLNHKKDVSLIRKGRLLLCVIKDDHVDRLAFEAIVEYFNKAKFRSEP